MQGLLFAFLTILLALGGALGGALGQAFNATASTRSYVYDSQLPARLQWLPNSGYCGEVSVVMATLRVGGSYYSQYDVRAISAVRGSDVQVKRFYLVGENDQHASDLLKLTYLEFDNSGTPDPRRYLAWIKKMTRAGHAVTICVFMNHKMFYGINKDDAGEYDYDHIVSVARVESNYDDDEYHEDDVVTMEDHGLYAPNNNPIYYFSYTFKDFIGTRAQSNNNNHVYSIPDVPQYGNFGIAHTGIQDKNKDCLPLLVQTSVNYEKPAIKNNSEDRPASMPLTLTITVTGLQDGVQYNLYTFDDETKVPVEALNANGAGVALTLKQFTGAASGKFETTEEITSDQKRIYRCVRADAK